MKEGICYAFVLFCFVLFSFLLFYFILFVYRGQVQPAFLPLNVAEKGLLTTYCVIFAGCCGAQTVQA